ncbi:DUF1751-domain-containing protein [Cutaneotrichosporon oleaginosum]|uniref:DUF1751-domain-containing protein n=1 Tax=Cutaneotrichosporon oleaginosum TaxID=879819 RepID=A0A0J0XG07_9TREE|nr:DUF1751-domain-containing protein [Cutaneotrichosporon oleaginosum]KLT40001.1 DUF1751-domain-containing protein [Cutaneotrichosporon oleaginosum]TXT14191.1 hypothetical protein COLE_00384 [Cutaneotrichosporon oleaginosum]
MPPISFLPFLQTVPWGTRVLTALVIVASLTQFLLASVVRQSSSVSPAYGHELPWLVLIPSTSWKFPWTLLTAGFVELNIFEFLFSLITVPLACRYLERLWGIRELARFTCVVIVASNIIAFGFAWILYILLGSDAVLSGLPFHGLSGVQSGILVAFTQIIPEHQIQLFGVLKARVKTIPGIFLLVSNVLVILLGPSPFILIQFGFFVAWVYLRFFKLSENGEYRGDRSETFAFQYWFPPFVRPYIVVLANHVFRLAVKVRLVQPWDDAMGTPYTVLPGPGGARAEAERRRELALRALDARLATSSPTPSAPPAAVQGPPASKPAVEGKDTQSG